MIRVSLGFLVCLGFRGCCRVLTCLVDQLRGWVLPIVGLSNTLTLNYRPQVINPGGSTKGRCNRHQWALLHFVRQEVQSCQSAFTLSCNGCISLRPLKMLPGYPTTYRFKGSTL